MREISLSIPTLESEQNIDIEVKINGKRRSLHYRVEIIALDDKDWQLVQIGAPSEKHIPIMFRRRLNPEEGVIPGIARPGKESI